MTAQNQATPVPDIGALLVSRSAASGADIATIQFNRPEQMNPLDMSTIRQLRTVLDDLVRDDPPRGLIITGSGEAFSSGGDLIGYRELYRDSDAFRIFLNDFDGICRLIENSPMATVAMINGTCVAGGLEIALACDFITIAEDARVGDGHLRFGQLPGGGGSQRLVRAVGVARARKWLLTARLFSAQEAVSDGLAIFSAPLDELEIRTTELLTDVCRHTPLGLAEMKRLISIAQNEGLYEGIAAESDIVHAYATESQDATEGLNAFAERRPPRFLGR